MMQEIWYYWKLLLNSYKVMKPHCGVKQSSFLTTYPSCIINTLESFILTLQKLGQNKHHKQPCNTDRKDDFKKKKNTFYSCGERKAHQTCTQQKTQTKTLLS